MTEPYNSMPPKPWMPVEIIPLAVAIYCADCANVTRAKNGQCPACRSTAVVRLSIFLESGDSTK
jgi:hypothetical protein